ncbi:metallothiol transferase FosB [Halobacillus locisalis]|uniref:Metallothiol transferase FosB n=1 Tax=Halobacillus locisalis TaxID=220753 RepID=A0A838CRB0_9BACI|nr:metallothiol transferase FosB [Halobacillus locisalis]MBA2174166.1 metallothiol transferase FosB [Halobacillus locisalis]
MIKGINHLCFSVKDLKRSIWFYEEILEGNLLVKGNTTAYFDLNGLWIALNEEKDAGRDFDSYTHTAFSIDEKDITRAFNKLVENGVTILKGRKRHSKDKRSIYFLDPDGHTFEFHTGSFQDRIDYYKEEKTNMEFYQ